jgi:hypothetical protein
MDDQNLSKTDQGEPWKTLGVCALIVAGLFVTAAYRSPPERPLWLRDYEGTLVEESYIMVEFAGYRIGRQATLMNLHVGDAICRNVITNWEADLTWEHPFSGDTRRTILTRIPE